MKVVKWLDDHLEETFLVILLILIFLRQPVTGNYP